MYNWWSQDVSVVLWSFCGLDSFLSLSKYQLDEEMVNLLQICYASNICTLNWVRHKGAHFSKGQPFLRVLLHFFKRNLMNFAKFFFAKESSSSTFVQAPE